MAQLNKTLCAEAFGNTGVGDCPFIPKHVVGMFIVPNDFAIDESDMENLKTFLQDAAYADNRRERILPVHGFVGIEDNTEDLVAETLGYGGIAVIREGKYDLTFRLGNGGLCLLKSLRKYNNRPVNVLLILSGGTILGVRSGNTMKGIPVDMFYALPLTFSDGSGTTTSFRVRLVIRPEYINDVLAFVETSSDGFIPDEITGVMDAAVIDAGSASNSVKVKVEVGCGGSNLIEDYETEMADETLWVVTDPTDGSTQTVTAVNIVDGVATLVGANLPARVNLAPISVLKANGVVGYEGIATTITA